MNTDINIIQNRIIQDFKQFNDWFEIYEYLITLGNKLEPLDGSLKIDKYSIAGCQSLVWLYAELKDNTIYFIADSESGLIKGLISLLLKVVNNQTPDKIIDANLYFIDVIGLKTHLSPSRANGLLSIIDKIKSTAQTFSQNS
jgi:cysteine desulfuration protein SufE